MSTIWLVLFNLVTCALPPQESVNSHILAEVPIESDGDAMTVTLDVDGKPCLSLLDFGNLDLMLDTRAFKYPSTGEPPLQVRGANGENWVLESVHSPKSLKLQGVPLFVHPVSVSLNLNHDRFRYGRPLQGIVGLQQFQDYVVELDWDSKQLRLRDDIPQGLVNSVSFTRTLHQSRPDFAGTIARIDGTASRTESSATPLTEEERLQLEFESPQETHSMRFQLDTKLVTPDEVLLTPQRTQTLIVAGLLKTAPRQEFLNRGADGKRVRSVLNNLSIANTRSTQLWANTDSNTPQNVLTIAWMLRFHLAIDLKNQRLYLGPRKSAPPPLRNPDLTGLTLSGDEKLVDESVIRVVEVKPNSIAARAGIQAKNQVTRFNGIKLGQFRPYEVWLAQRIPGSQHTLRVRRSEKEFDVQLKIPAASKSQ